MFNKKITEYKKQIFEICKLGIKSIKIKAFTYAN